MDNCGIISVRTASTRLPEKCLFKFGDGNVLEHMIRRAKHFGFTPVVATSTLREDDVIEEICCKEDCFFYRGSAEDKLQRWLDTCEFYEIEKFVTLDGDDLFFDPDLARLGLLLLEEQDEDESYDIIYPPPEGACYVGSFSFALTRDIIERACALKDSNKTEMMWHFIEKVPNVRRGTLGIMTSRLGQRPFRLTLDYPEDYWLLDTVRRILGHFAITDKIAGLFAANPNLRDVNWFRNEEMKRGHEVGGSGLL